MTARLNQGKGDHIDAAQQEAELIRGLSGERTLRLHVVGDCKDRVAATVSKAAEEYRAKQGQLVWTYTRAWEQVPRASWGSVSVLASCETPAQVRRARRRGYATAIVVGEFAQPTAYKKSGVKIVPCPQETAGCRHAPTVNSAGRTTSCDRPGTRSASKRTAVAPRRCGRNCCRSTWPQAWRSARVAVGRASYHFDRSELSMGVFPEARAFLRSRACEHIPRYKNPGQSQVTSPSLAAVSR